jgi:hypothetical protein
VGSGAQFICLVTPVLVFFVGNEKYLHTYVHRYSNLLISKFSQKAIFNRLIDVYVKSISTGVPWRRGLVE